MPNYQYIPSAKSGSNFVLSSKRCGRCGQGATWMTILHTPLYRANHDFYQNKQHPKTTTGSSSSGILNRLKYRRC